MDSSGDEDRPPAPPVRNASTKEYQGEKPLPSVPQLDDKKKKMTSFRLFPSGKLLIRSCSTNVCVFF